MLETAEIVALRERSCAELITHATRQIKEVLEVTHCHFVLGTVVDARIPLLGHDGAVARNGHVVDVDREGLTAFETARVVTLHGVQVGSFRVISPARLTHPSREQRLVAVLLADQVSAAFSA